MTDELSREDEREMTKQIRWHLVRNPELKYILLSDVESRMSDDLGVPVCRLGQGQYARDYTPQLRGSLLRRIWRWLTE